MVTKTLRDTDTQKTILCVYVMTAVVPPAGFTLFVPEEDVTNVDWTTKETFEILLSGGMTAPAVVRYETGGPTKLIVPGDLAPAEPGRDAQPTSPTEAIP